MPSGYSVSKFKKYQYTLDFKKIPIINLIILYKINTYAYSNDLCRCMVFVCQFASLGIILSYLLHPWDYSFLAPNLEYTFEYMSCFNKLGLKVNLRTNVGLKPVSA